MKLKVFAFLKGSWRAGCSGIFILFSLFIFFMLPSCLSFKISQAELDKKFAKSPVKPVLHDVANSERNIRYAEIGNDSLPVVIFIHGSPGSWSAWVDFFQDADLLKRVKMVAVDRPGFGDSGYGISEPSLEKQAIFLKPILEKYQKNRPMILVGHSLGGPMLARIAIDFPNLADGLIWVAPSIDPKLEKVLWYQKVGDWPIVRWALPGSIKASNQEILPLKAELEKMVPYWDKITQRSIYIHGTADFLVPVENTDFARKMLKSSKTDYVIVKEMSHFVPWEHPELIKNAIFKILDEQKPRIRVTIK
jgi:pimeloyl-ACP methyl ester carboxylesterase